ncbi:MAG: urease accessory protein UreE [Pseudomonadota bacterium]
MTVSPAPASAPGPIRAAALLPGAGAGASDAVTLDYEGRWRRRGMLTTEGGERVLLDLAQAAELEDGDALALEDGRRVAVRAAAEPLTEVRAEDARHLTRLAWHLGNRHLPVQIEAERLLIRHDHVLEDMLRRLGARLVAVEAPFTPERGAYGHGRTHGHSHSHDPHEDPDAALRDHLHG